MKTSDENKGRRQGATNANDASLLTMWPAAEAFLR